MTDTICSTSLWSNRDRTRFFLIPDGRPLPSGEFRIHTVTGRKLAVDLKALNGFEINDDEAKRYLRSQLSAMLDGARGAVDRFIDRLNGVEDRPLSPICDAIEALECAFKTYQSSRKIETEGDIRALKDYARRTMEIAERMQSFANR